MKRWRKAKFALCLSWDIHLLLNLDIGPPNFWVFRIRLELISLVPLVLRPPGLDWNSTSGFQGLQIADSRSWGFAASIILEPISHKSISICLYISIYTYHLSFYHLLLVLFLQRPLINIGILNYLVHNKYVVLPCFIRNKGHSPLLDSAYVTKSTSFYLTENIHYHMFCFILLVSFLIQEKCLSKQLFYSTLSINKI